VGQKRKPDYYCSNFIYCQPTVTIVGTYTLPAYRKLASGGYVRHAKQLATARNHSKQTKKS